MSNQSLIYFVLKTDFKMSLYCKIFQNLLQTSPEAVIGTRTRRDADTITYTILFFFLNT